MQDQIDIFHDTLRSDGEDPPSIPEYYTTFAPEFHLKFLNHPNLRAETKQITQEEARRIYAFATKKYFLKAAEDIISGTSQIGFKYANNNLKNHPSVS